MTPQEFREAREKILAGFASRRNSRKIMGLLLGYSPQWAASIISAKEKGHKPISRSDEQIIKYLLIMRQHRLIMYALATLPELNEGATK
jgi:hypothetical protein